MKESVQLAKYVREDSHLVDVDSVRNGIGIVAKQTALDDGIADLERRVTKDVNSASTDILEDSLVSLNEVANFPFGRSSFGLDDEKGKLDRDRRICHSFEVVERDGFMQVLHGVIDGG